MRGKMEKFDSTWRKILCNCYGHWSNRKGERSLAGVCGLSSADGRKDEYKRNRELMTYLPYCPLTLVLSKRNASTHYLVKANLQDREWLLCEMRALCQNLVCTITRPFAPHYNNITLDSRLNRFWNT